MAEYYQGKDIVVRFDVFKDGRDAKSISATVVVYDPSRDFVCKEAAKVEGNEVRFILKGDKVEEVGRYYFVFEVRVKQLGKYPHIVKIDVKKMPIKPKKVKV